MRACMHAFTHILTRSLTHIGDYDEAVGMYSIGIALDQRNHVLYRYVCMHSCVYFCPVCRCVYQCVCLCVCEGVCLRVHQHLHLLIQQSIY